MNNQSMLFKNFSSRLGSILKKNVPFLILIFLVFLFSFIAPNFMTFGNLRTLIRQISFAGISAIGLMFVMISGGIDLSLGSQIVFSNVFLAIMMVDWNLPPAVAIPLILLFGFSGKHQRRLQLIALRLSQQSGKNQGRWPIAWHCSRHR